MSRSFGGRRCSDTRTKADAHSWSGTIQGYCRPQAAIGQKQTSFEPEVVVIKLS